MVYFIGYDLCRYVQQLNYERVRYNALMSFIKRDFYPMSDEEWLDSYNYYSIKQIEANISFNTALEAIEEMYNFKFADCKEWAFNFEQASLYTNEDKSPHEKALDYPNFLLLIYGNDKPYGAKDITLQITENCNMRCTYCYQHHKTNNKMSFETATKTIDLILDNDERVSNYCKLDDNLGLIFNYIGGEPLLEIELIDKVTKYCIGRMFKMKHPFLLTTMFNICSNGLLHFDPKVQDYLKTFEGFCNYTISLDGCKDLHDSCRVDANGMGTYDRAIKGIQDYTSKFPNNNLGTKMTLSPDNVSYTCKALTSMIENGFTDINCNCVYEEGWTIEHARILYSELKKVIDYLDEHNLLEEVYISILDPIAGEPMPETDLKNWCGGTGLMLAVNYTGNFYPCLRYMETSQQTEDELFIIGNIEDGIGQKETEKAKIQLLDSVDRKTQSTDECFNCPIASGCGWCSAYNYECFKTVNKRATYICETHKARTLAIYYYLIKKGTPKKTFYCPKDWAINIIGEQEYEFLKERMNA